MGAVAFSDYLKKLNLFAPSAQAASDEPVRLLAERTQQAQSFCAADLTVEGSLHCESDLLIEGHIRGNVSCKGDVTVHGTVTGNIEGRNVLVCNATVEGDIRATESLSTRGSRIKGNITSATADINSAVEGDVTAANTLVIRREAAVKGNLAAGAISIEENAVLDGSIRICRPE